MEGFQVLNVLTKGALAGFLTTPFDVIKTNIMTSSVAKSTSIPSVAKQIWKTGGLTRFFVGGSARTVWW
jgi:hypothetical protein